MFCLSITRFNVQAALVEDESVSTIEIEPRTILHLTKAKYNSNGTIEVRINYSIQDSSGQVIGVQSAYISYYDPARYRAVKVMNYGISGGSSNSMYVTVSYQYINDNPGAGWHNETVVISP